MTTGMSAPPIGMMIEHAEREGDEGDQPEQHRALHHHEQHDEQYEQRGERDVDRHGAAAEGSALPDIRPSSFRKAMIEPVKVIAPIATPIDISTRLWAWIAAGVPMPKACGA